MKTFVSCNTCEVKNCLRLQGEDFYCKYRPNYIEVAKQNPVEELKEGINFYKQGSEIFIKIDPEIIRLLNVVYIESIKDGELRVKKFVDEASGFFSLEPGSEINFDDSYLDNGEKDPNYEKVEKLIAARGNIQKVFGV